MRIIIELDSNTQPEIQFVLPQSNASQQTATSKAQKDMGESVDAGPPVFTTIDQDHQTQSATAAMPQGDNTEGFAAGAAPNVDAV